MTPAAPPLPDAALLRERKIEVRRLGLHLRVWGDASKPLVLLQHGGKDHGRSWDWTVEALREDYCLAVPDLRGHGDSDWPTGGGYESFDFVSDMAAIVEHLVSEGHDAPIHIIGHSLGGNIALNYAAAQPHRVRSVIAIEGLGFSQKSYDELTAKRASERMREGVERRLKVAQRKPRRFRSAEEGIKRLANLHQQLSPEQAEHLALHALREHEDGWSWKHDPLLGFMPIRPMPPSEYGQLFADIEAPVLLMYGRESWASSPKDDGRLEYFGRAELIEFDNAGHWLHHDRFEDFISRAKKFLRSHS
ncbi:alpha/beta fold hydrolase [Parvularcula lutaonensis]|uniref:Alpha/beta fold hydrolase n=1 Tax=Parvularcula lutaonensis TaxID=491923 RepID=A0ABV7MAP7_9PROT|nr:alpha/beta hydrolase [Parvularcula lutaonensis]GGY38304.1 hydrolase [Parvularcula lutaonensis]